MSGEDLDRPILEQFRAEDRLLADFLEHAKQTLLNVREWNFHIDSLNEDISFKKLAKKISNTRLLDIPVSDTLRFVFLQLPHRFDIITDDLLKTFKRFTLNAQDRDNFILKQQKYIGNLESKLNLASDELNVFKENAKVSDLSEQIKTLSESIDSLKDDFEDLSENVSKPIVPEAVPVELIEEIPEVKEINDEDEEIEFE